MKKQSRKVGVSGGFINQMMGNNSSIPIVGEGATILMYSDRKANEVIEVSEDGNSCVIREVLANHIGKSYGDERYEYSSNPSGITKTLEWNEKKKCWGESWDTIHIIKSDAKKYSDKYGYGWTDIYLEERGLTYDDLLDASAMRDGYTRYKLIEGVTKRYKNFSKVSVIFGIMEEYRDPSF